MEIPSNIAINFFKSHLNGVATAGVHYAKCPICGDKKRRMYLLNKNREWGVYCHNCGYSSGLLWFIKNEFPTQYDYVMNQCVNGFFFEETIKKKPEKKKDETEDLLDIINLGMGKIGTSKPKKKSNEVLEYLREYGISFSADFGKRTNLQSVVAEQRLVLQDRRIPQDIIDKCWYIYKKHPDKNYKDRVAIPFFDEDGEMMFFQAMATDKRQKPKYLNWESDVLTNKPEYNEHHVDKDKTVYIVEGLFDSMFVKNSVSTLGANLSFSKISYFKKKYPNRVWVLDNPRCDTTANRITRRLFNKGESCAIFPYKYRRVKDLNELALLLKEDDLTQIVEENVYNSITGLVELGR